MKPGALVLTIVLLFALAGCGGGVGTETGNSAQFRVNGGDNSVQEFGSEAGQAEFEQATGALHGFFDARAEDDWATACEYLASSFTRELVRLSGKSRTDCPDTLANLLGDTPAATLREAAVADVGSLRAEDDRGFLLYRGAENRIYAIGMADDGGAWKVASLAGTPLD